ncbi:MAG: hypothetical protein RLZZ436_1094 [Planctomycetota bacterium]|jgi:SAM-dependent methyltransferase
MSVGKIDLTAITSSLTRRDDGIWVACEQRAVSYPDEGNDACYLFEDDSFWFQHRNRVITELVSRFSPQSTFFDIGGGNGCVSNALQQAGIDTVLVEPGPAGARNARKRGLSNVIQSTLEDAGFAERSISAAGVFDVVEHIEQHDHFISNLGRFLQPNGLLYITVPAFRFLWSFEDEYAGHFRRYTTRSLTELLTRNGFTVNYCGYLFSFLLPPILLLRSIPCRLGLRKTVSVEVARKEHSGGSRITRQLTNSLLNRELHSIRRLKQIPFGSSCIAVATKTR